MLCVPDLSPSLERRFSNLMSSHAHDNYYNPRYAHAHRGLIMRAGKNNVVNLLYNEM